MSRPTLIFDLGGVLLHIRYNRFLETLGLNHELNETLLLEKMMPHGGLYESGKISTEEFFHRLHHALNTTADEKRLHEAWLSILDGEIEGMLELVDRFAREDSLYLLSNTNPLHFEYAVRKFPLLHHFKHYFVSYKIGAMKPAPEIYHHVVQTLGKQPEELLFIDDMEKNVIGARKVGMQSELFAGVTPLKKMLEKIMTL
jgi:HAD superfamily hydrolase (TIGR01509 family)